MTTKSAANHFPCFSLTRGDEVDVFHSSFISRNAPERSGSMSTLWIG